LEGGAVEHWIVEEGSRGRSIVAGYKRRGPEGGRGVGFGKAMGHGN
jgi:hypothetical protein